MTTLRIWNGTVVTEKPSKWSHNDNPMKGVVISQTEDPMFVIVRWEGGNIGEWKESVHDLVVLEESPLYDGTRAYS